MRKEKSYKLKTGKENYCIKEREIEIFEKYRVKMFVNSFSKCRLRAVDLWHGGVRVCFESVTGGCATICSVRSIPRGNNLCF